MVQSTFNSGYVNIGGVPLGEPISSPFDPKKHLEANSYNRIFGKDNTWLGILNLLDKYNKIKMPFISMTELSNNVLETDGPGSAFTFGIPFMKGCPFLLENLCADNPKPGYGNQPFFIVLSENVYTYGDVITTDYRNGKQLRIQRIKDKGPEAEIVPHLNGWRYMVALDGFDEEDYYPQEFLEEGTAYYKLFSLDGAEFDHTMSGYSGMDEDSKTALQLYQYTVGTSDQAIHTWVTADATYKNYRLENKIHPAVAHLQGASTDVLTYWTGAADGTGAKAVFWIPQFIQKLGMELAKMKENFLLWNQGKSLITNGREKIVTGLGWYQQIKQRGNYDTYSDFRQLLNMVLNFSEKLFTVHNQVAPIDRVVRLKAGKLAYQELRKQFSQYFKTDNPFQVFADHPALIKAGLLTNDNKGGLIYKPVQFNGIFFPEQGTLLVEHDPTLDRLDDYLEHPAQSSYMSTTSGTIFIEDITDGNFTNAIPTELKGGMKHKNTVMIKKRGYKDKLEFKVNSDCSEELLSILGVPGQGKAVTSWNKGLEIRLSTHGELWVQDPSRVWLIEYDPYGVIAKNNYNFTNFAI